MAIDYLNTPTLSLGISSYVSNLIYLEIPRDPHGKG